jgi:predicted nucleotidyltransferase
VEIDQQRIAKKISYIKEQVTGIKDLLAIKNRQEILSDPPKLKNTGRLIIMDSSIDVSKYLKVWMERKHFRPNPNLQEPLRREALKKINYAAEIVKEKYPYLELYLFGSLIWNNFFTEHSDIDVAVKGLKDKTKFLDLYGLIWDSVLPFNVDVIPLENATDNLRQRIINEGLKL